MSFRYTVAQGDGDDADGASVKANSLTLNGGTINNIADNKAINLNHNGVDGGTSHRVNATPPTVSSLAFTSTGPYKVGSTIEVTVTMNEAVAVTGTPTLTLVVGTESKTANYTSGTGTKKLVFEYTVADGDEDDTNGVSVTASSLAVSSGTITDNIGNPATLTHTAADGGTDHRVDTSAPTVSSVAFTSTGPYGPTDTVEVTVTMNENVNVTGTPTLTLVVGSTNKDGELRQRLRHKSTRLQIHYRYRR